MSGEKITQLSRNSSNIIDRFYRPKKLQFWVANAKSKEERAAEQPYTFFDFGKALREF